MLVHSPQGAFEFIDFREKAPAAATQDMFNNNTEASLFGGLARYGCCRFSNSVKLISTPVAYQGTFAAWIISTKTTDLCPGRL